MFPFDYLINRTQKNSKNNSKKLRKTRQLSQKDILDSKLECAKTFLMKFCLHGSNFRRKIQSILEHSFRDSDKNTLPLLQRRRARDKGLRGNWP